MMELKGLTIVSLNTQSLGTGVQGVRKRTELKRFLTGTSPRSDIVLIQEHHLPIQECIQKGNKLLFRGGVGLWNDATYSPQSQRHQGGMAILLSAKAGSALEEHGILLQGRMQFAVIRVTRQLKVGIINVYGYNDNATRSQVWTELHSTELPEAEWIIGGDFNMIEEQEDKQGGRCHGGIRGRESRNWQSVKFRFGLQDSFRLDTFRKTTNKIYTWENRRPPPNTVLSRIDRFYVSGTIAQQGGKIGIWPTLPHISDHAPLYLHFREREFDTHRRTHFDNLFLAEDHTKIQLLGAWQTAIRSSESGSWTNKIGEAIEEVKTTNDILAKDRSKQRKKDFQEQFKAVKAAELQLQID